MDKFEIEKTCYGFCIRAMDGRHAFPLYVSGARGGSYRWTTDLLYAKRFCKATAEKHLEILRRI